MHEEQSPTDSKGRVLYAQRRPGRTCRCRRRSFFTHCIVSGPSSASYLAREHAWGVTSLQRTGQERTRRATRPGLANRAAAS